MNSFFIYFVEQNICPICKDKLIDARFGKRCFKSDHYFSKLGIRFRNANSDEIASFIKLNQDKRFSVIEIKYGPILEGNLDDFDLYVENVENTIQKLKNIFSSTLKKIELNQMFR